MTYGRRMGGGGSQPPRRKLGLPVVGAAVGGLLLAGVLIVVSLNPPTPATPADLPRDATTLGQAGAPVTVEEWGDYQCPICRQFTLTTGAQLADQDIRRGAVKLVWRDMAFIGEESGLAAEGARCAAEQGMFWQYHDKLYAEQRGENTGGFPVPFLKKFAGAIGASQAAFDACIDSHRHAAAVKAETDAGRTRGVRATPTFFVNGQKFEGIPSYEQLSALILGKPKG